MVLVTDHVSVPHVPVVVEVKVLNPPDSTSAVVGEMATVQIIGFIVTVAVSVILSLAVSVTVTVSVTVASVEPAV